MWGVLSCLWRLVVSFYSGVQGRMMFSTADSSGALRMSSGGHEHRNSPELWYSIDVEVPLMTIKVALHCGHVGRLACHKAVRLKWMKKIWRPVSLRRRLLVLLYLTEMWLDLHPPLHLMCPFWSSADWRWSLHIIYLCCGDSCILCLVKASILVLVSPCGPTGPRVRARTQWSHSSFRRLIKAHFTKYF